MSERNDLRKTGLDLNAATKAAIRHLKRTEHWSNREVGERIGYPDGQMVGKVLREECRLLGTVQTMNLARLASRHGHDPLADLFSAPSKVSVPALEGAPGEEWAADRCVTEEVAGVTTGTGTFAGLVAAGQYRAARQWLRTAIAWLQRCWRELDRIEEDGHAPRYSGDSLPAEPALAPS